MVLPVADYDGPWKEVLDHYLPEVMAFFFPAAHREIDWSAPPKALEQELRRATPKGERTKQAVDKLFQVRRLNGQPAWVLVHLEVQSQRDRVFEARMFRYHARLYDAHQQQVVSIAILGDDEPTWRPFGFGYDLWGCSLALNFPVIKLLDYDLAVLEADPNPCAMVVLAHRYAQATRHDVDQRVAVKRHLTRLLYRRGYDREQILTLYHFIDWLLRLPDDLDQQLWQELQAFEEEQQMTYITSAERFGYAAVRAEEARVRAEEARVRAEAVRVRGEEERVRAEEERVRAELAQGRAEILAQQEQFRAAGLREGLAFAMEMKFGGEATAFVAELHQITDLALLQTLAARMRTAATLDELRALYRT